MPLNQATNLRFTLGGRLGLARFPLPRREFKRYLSHIIHHEISREWFSGFGNEIGQQIGFVFGENLGCLGAVNRLLQNHLRDFEFAGTFVALRFFAKVTRLSIEDAATAFGTLANGFEAGEINLGRGSFGCTRLRRAFGRPRGPRLEFKTHRCVFDDQVSFEGAAFFGNEFFEQVGFAGLQEFLDLGALDGPLQNDLADAPKVARGGGADGFFADEVHGRFKNPAAALRTFADRLLAGEIHLGYRAVGFGLVLAEVEFGLELRSHLYDRGKRPALLAAETLKRTDLPVCEQFLDFGNLELAAGNDFPKTEIAFLALELLVILVNFTTAFRAASFQRAEVPGHGIAV